MDFHAVRTIARQELIVNIRNRWTLIFAASFGVLALAISYFGLITAGRIGAILPDNCGSFISPHSHGTQNRWPDQIPPGVGRGPISRACLQMVERVVPSRVCSESGNIRGAGRSTTTARKFANTR